MKLRKQHNFKIYFVIVLVSVVISVAISYLVFSFITKKEVSLEEMLKSIVGILGMLLAVIIALTSILDYCNDKGYVIIKSYSQRRDKKIFDLITLAANKTICEKDPILLAKQDALLEKILASMGLKYGEYNEIPLLYRKLQYTKTIDSNSEDTYIDALKCMCINDSVLIDLTSAKSGDKKYPVDYYLNFVDFLCNNFLENENYNLESMARMIRHLILRYHISINVHENLHRDYDWNVEYEIENNLSEQNYKIAIPENGNLFLGLKVASIMKLNVVRFLNYESYKTGKYWDGNFDSDSNIIIVHDVLVTGEQIIKAINLCKKMKVKNIEVYTLVERTDNVFKGRQKVDKENITYNCLIQLDDNKIKSLLKEE